MNSFKENLFKIHDKILYAKDGWLVEEDPNGNIEKIKKLDTITVNLDKLEYKLKNEHRS